MILQKKSQYVTERPYTTELEVLKRPQEIYQTYVLPVLQERRKNAANAGIFSPKSNGNSAFI